MFFERGDKNNLFCPLAPIHRFRLLGIPYAKQMAVVIRCDNVGHMLWGKGVPEIGLSIFTPNPVICIVLSSLHPFMLDIPIFPVHSIVLCIWKLI